MMNVLTAAQINTQVNYRPGRLSDSFTVFNIFEQALADLSRRIGEASLTSAADPQKMQEMWLERRSLYEHLARSADQFWIAERDGCSIGFARSILRDGIRQLTELFVLPGEQSGGVGRELIARTIPMDDNSRHLSILTTADRRAQTLYHKAGVYPRFPFYYFSKQPEQVDFNSDLRFVEIEPTSKNMRTIASIDRQVLGFSRGVDHEWLLSERQGFLYFRYGQPVGYGYIGVRNGPFAVLEKKDFSAVLAHAETQSARRGRAEFGLEVPMVNQAAVDFLLERGFKVDTFIAILMNDHPFSGFDRYILTSPPFFL
jgi:GNAT superfamily N-acetyltransferase